MNTINPSPPPPNSSTTFSDLLRSARAIASPAVISRGAAAFVVLTGCLVLIGWLLDVSALKSLHPNLVSMKANAAILLILSGASCWLAWPTETIPQARRVREGAAAFVILVAALTLVEWLFGFDLGIDQLLFRDTPGTVGTLYPGRVAPWTALAFLSTGSAVLLLDARAGWARCLFSCLALSGGLIALLSLTGYAYGAELLYGIGLHFHIAVPTCVAFLFLTVAILFARPDQGVMAFVLGDTAGGRMVRRLIPSFALVLFAFGWLEQVGQKVQWFDASLGTAMLVLASILVSAGLITLNALALNQAEAQRRRAEEDLRTANTTLEARVAERTGAAGARAHELLRLIGDLQKEVAERQRSEEALRASEERTRMILDTANDPFITINARGEILDWNRQAELVFGRSREEAIGRILSETIVPPQHREAHDRGLRDFLVTGNGPVLNTRIELTALRRDGNEFPVELLAWPIRMGGVLTISAFVRDITEPKQAAERLRRSNRALLALSNCNQALIRATDETGLLQQICQIVVAQAGYHLCWVGYADQDEAKTVRPVAQAGLEEGYLKTVNVTWADTERGQGPTGACIRTGRTVLVKNMATDPAFALWRAEALKRGYASSIAIPLSNSTTFGALTIYASEPEAFGEEEVKLLTELAGDLAFGVMALRTKAERTKAVELEAAHERDTKIGSEIQQTLLVNPLPSDLRGLHVAALSVPSQHIDGDFYYFYKHEDQCVDLIVADVMGKGIPAALLGAATKSHFLEALCHLLDASPAGVLPEPKDIVTLAHAVMVQHLIDLDSFVTLCYVRFDPDRRTIEFVDAGHTGLIHRKAATGRCEVLHGDNLPLGFQKRGDLQPAIRFV